jgi:hypothetical protein
MAKSGTQGLEFIRQALRRDRGASFGDIKGKAEKKGLKIYPIMYGRAQALEGIVKMRPRGQGKAARKSAGGIRRGPGRPPKSASLASLEAVIHAMRDSDRQREVCRRALEQIQRIVQNVL